MLVGLAVLIVGGWPAWRNLTFSYHWAEAQRALDTREFSSAISHLEQARRIRPSDSTAALQLAMAYRRGGLLDRVESQLGAAQTLGCAQRDVQLQRLLLRAQIGRFREVEPELRSYFEEGVDDKSAFEIYEALALGYWADHDLNEAMRCLKYWSEWRPADSEPRLMKAEIFNAHNDPVSAEKEYRGVLDFDPQNAVARAALGKLLIKRGQIEEAEKHLQLCQSQGHDTVPIRIALAECDYRLGRAEVADQRLAAVDYQILEPEGQAEALKLMADIARFRRDHQKAVRLLENALQIWPHNSGIHETLGQVYAAVGKVELAEKHLELSREINKRGQRFHDLQREVTKRPQDPEVRFQVGDVLRQQGFPDDGASWWRSALRCDRYHQASHEALTKYHAERGDTDLASQHKRSAQLSVEVTFRRAWAALQANDLEAAGRGRALLELYPDKAVQVELLKAGLLAREKKFAEAAPLLKRPLEDTVLRLLARGIQGEILIGEGKLLEAEPILQAVVSENPNDVNTVRWLAVLYYDLGAVEQADLYLKRVAELDPGDYRAHRLLGLIHKDYEKYSEAVAFYRESLQRNPQQPPREEVLLELAECLIKLRKHSDALIVLQQAQPSPSRQVMGAECQFHLGHRDEAVQTAQAVLDQDPQNLAALVLLSDVAMVERNYSRAVELLRKVVADNPFDYVAHHKLSQALSHEESGGAAARQLATRAEELKQAWQHFSQLNKEAMRKPYDAAVRRELAQQADSLGRADLAQVWRQAAEMLEPVQTPEAPAENKPDLP